MLIKTSDDNAIGKIIKQFNFPKSDSHKGQNGKILVIGGSSLFHSASIWAAEISSFFVDMVHYCSTKENNEVFLSLKKKFRNGIVVPQADVENYVQEDDVVLIGPGMMRGDNTEAFFAKSLIKKLIDRFPNKKFVFDAGALQNMNPEWLKQLNQPAIVTPQSKEFETLFGITLKNKTREEKTNLVEKKAKEYKAVILLKTVSDIISDGAETYIIEGGNAGLTKGGTGDILAGLTASFYAKNKPAVSAILASLILKKTVDKLYLKQGNWYNIGTIIEEIPKSFFDLSNKKI